MHSPSFSAVFEKLESSSSMIWTSLLTAIVVYVAVAYLGGIQVEDASLSSAAPYIFPLLALANGLFAAVLSGKLLSKERIEKLYQETSGRGEALRERLMKGKSQSAREEISQLSEEEVRLIGTAARILPLYVVPLAVAESVGIFGLVHAILSGTPEVVFPYAVVAALLFLKNKPNLKSDLSKLDHLTSW